MTLMFFPFLTIVTTRMFYLTTPLCSRDWCLLLIHIHVHPWLVCAFTYTHIYEAFVSNWLAIPITSIHLYSSFVLELPPQNKPIIFVSVT